MCGTCAELELCQICTINKMYTHTPIQFLKSMSELGPSAAHHHPACTAEALQQQSHGAVIACTPGPLLVPPHAYTVLFPAVSEVLTSTCTPHCTDARVRKLASTPPEAAPGVGRKTVDACVATLGLASTTLTTALLMVPTEMVWQLRGVVYEGGPEGAHRLWP